MIHELKIEHKINNRDEAFYAISELKKAKETLKELMKNKNKYKNKIIILSQHIHNLRRNSKIKEEFKVILNRKKYKWIKKSFHTKKFQFIHSNICEHKEDLLETLKEIRRESRKKPMKWHLFGIKRYIKYGNNSVGFVYPKAGTIIELLKSKKIKTIENPKKPLNQNNHIGVEIEFASYLEKDQIGQLFLDADLIDYVQLQHEYVQGKDERGGEHEYELCVVATEQEIFNIIERVCVVLNEKVDANVTYGCGLHIHIDARNRDIKKMFDNLFNCQEILYSMVPQARRTNKHVQILSKKEWYPTQNGFKHQENCKDEKCVCQFENKDHFKNCAFRYYGLNNWSYVSHKTMEIRLHSGTSNANKINNWIKLLLNIVDGKSIKSYINTVEDFRSIVKLDKKLLDYVEKRVEYFKKDATL